MGILRSQEDSWTQEMAKWEQRPVVVGGTLVEPIPFTAGGHGNMPFAAYPKALYRAEAADGGPRISGYKTVPDASAEALAKGQGWFETQEAALADVPRRQRELATLAANRAHNERWMSEAAKAEAATHDEQTMQHLPVIPETPIKRRGRPATVKESAV